ncbi:hypothetical protein [Sulfuricurvum sp.]|uniref:hypothetical protein n=1 Tax=Sulfuricurvum sp. TaxID=2025608 RepID=UPI003562A712
MVKAATTQQAGIRGAKLHPDAEKLLKRHIEYVEKSGLCTKEDLMEMFYQVWEAGDNFAEQLIKRGYNDVKAQMYAIDSVKAQLGRKIIRPKYNVVFRPTNVRHETQKDEKIPTKTKHSVFAFGQGFVINPKNNNRTDEKFIEVSAWDADAQKLDDISLGNTYEFEASTSNITAPIINMTVDDRCKGAALSEQVLSDIEKLMTKNYDITPISEAGNNKSNGRNDYRLVEGRINFITFPKGKNYAKLELTDTSVGLDDLEKKKNQANLACLCNKETVSHIGKDSVVRILGNINVKEDETYGTQVTLFFPPMIYPMLLTPPEVVDEKPASDDTEDASDYFSKKAAKEKEDSNKYFKEEKTDEPPAKVEAPEETPEVVEEAPAEVEEEATDPDETVDLAKPEPVKKTPTKAGKSAPAKKDDIDADIKNHPCFKSGDFGHPNVKDTGCIECSKSEPKIYAACTKKK